MAISLDSGHYHGILKRLLLLLADALDGEFTPDSVNGIRRQRLPQIFREDSSEEHPGGCRDIGCTPIRRGADRISGYQ